LPVTIFSSLSFGGLKFYFEHTALQQKHLKLQRDYYEAQILHLQAQINPHHMFNVMNNIHVLMHADIDLASELLIKYADVLRYQLYQAEKEWIPLQQEIQFLEDYISVEKIRWNTTLVIDYNWKILPEHIDIPPLIFIVLVENAFKYVGRGQAEKGYINLSLTQQASSLQFIVKNSISEMTNNLSPAKGLGLTNLKKRLALLYPDAYSYVVDQQKDYYSVTLTLDITKNVK